MYYVPVPLYEWYILCRQLFCNVHSFSQQSKHNVQLPTYRETQWTLGREMDGKQKDTEFVLITFFMSRHSYMWTDGYSEMVV